MNNSSYEPEYIEQFIKVRKPKPIISTEAGWKMLAEHVKNSSDPEFYKNEIIDLLKKIVSSKETEFDFIDPETNETIKSKTNVQEAVISTFYNYLGEKTKIQ